MDMARRGEARPGSAGTDNKEDSVIETVALSELVEDLEIYPRGSVSMVRVGDLVYAMEAGAQLPPPVIDRDTRKIVDGFHRARAQRKRLGEDGTIDADVQEFADDAAMLLESARLNSVHGQPLGRYDQRVVHIKAKALGVSDEEVAGALNITTTRLLSVSIMEAKAEDGGADVPLKQGFKHLGGSYLTREQINEVRKARGAPARAKVGELTRLLRTGLLPIEHDPELRAMLAELAAVIGSSLGE